MLWAICLACSHALIQHFQHVMLMGLLQRLGKSDMETKTKEHHYIIYEKEEGSCLVLDESRISDGQKAALQTLTESFLLPNTHTRQWHTHVHAWTQRPRIPQCAVIQLDTLACCLTAQWTHSHVAPKDTNFEVTVVLVELLMLPEEQALGLDCFNGCN